MKSLLQFAPLYRLFTYLIGAYALRRRWVVQHVRPWPGAKVLDLGCGPADILGFMPEVRYTGVDPSAEYIASAKVRWGSKGDFQVASVESVEAAGMGHFDLVLASGLIHHLHDESAKKLVEIAFEALRPGGRFVTLDGYYYPGQSAAAKWFLRNDRGAFVRTEEHYLELLRHRFSKVQHRCDRSPLVVPYATVAFECTR